MNDDLSTNSFLDLSTNPRVSRMQESDDGRVWSDCRQSNKPYVRVFVEAPDLRVLETISIEEYLKQNETT